MRQYQSCANIRAALTSSSCCLPRLLLVSCDPETAGDEGRRTFRPTGRIPVVAAAAAGNRQSNTADDRSQRRHHWARAPLLCAESGTPSASRGAEPWRAATAPRNWHPRRASLAAGFGSNRFCEVVRDRSARALFLRFSCRRGARVSSRSARGSARMAASKSRSRFEWRACVT